MAITLVKAKLSDAITNLDNVKDDEYSGSLIVPDLDTGTYKVEITAESDIVGSAQYIRNVRVINDLGWQTPKTNWKPTDRFNWNDYNRIRSNLQWLYEKCCKISGSVDFMDMGSNIYDFEKYWEVEYFNAWEYNVEQLSKRMYKPTDVGTKLSFYENGLFIDWNELNRIESACLLFFDMLAIQELSVRRVPFRLGQFKAFR